MIDLLNFTNSAFEKAIELGNSILESEESIRLADARAAFASNINAQRAMQEYKKFQENMQMAIDTGFMTEDGYSKALKKLVELEIEVKNYPEAQNILKAEADFNSYVDSIMNMLTMTIQGAQGQGASICSCDTNRGGSCGCGPTVKSAFPSFGTPSAQSGGCGPNCSCV